MTDNEMMIALIQEIESQLTDYGLTDFEVSRNQHPTNQYTGANKGDPIKTRIFLFALTNPSEGKSRKYRGNTSNFERVDIQHKAKSIQISALHYFDESDINAKTPEDIANLVQHLIDSPDAIKNLRDNGVYLESAGDVRPVFFINDKDRTESIPNFDIVVKYTSNIVKGSGYVDHAEGDIERV